MNNNINDTRNGMNGNETETRDITMTEIENGDRTGTGSGNRPENENRKKKNKIWKKAAGVTAAALVFGTVSGSVMAGINVLGSAAYEQRYRTVATQETVGAIPAVSTSQNQVVQTSGVNDVSAIVEAAMPSVVAINDKMTVEQQTFFGPQSVEAESSGSGIIIGKNDTELLIATNNHVVDGADNLKVTFVDNAEVSAAIKGTDEATDLAIVAVPLDQISADTMGSIKVASIGDSDALKVGQQVVAIGNALGEGQSATVGYVSALNREVKGEDESSRTFIQTDAAINPGNSGGALLDLNGSLIGINAAKAASTEVEGMGYAIPISKAMEVLNELSTKQTRVKLDESRQGFLGIQGMTVDMQISQAYGMPEGIYVYKITDSSPAAASELKEKDIITKFDGQSVKNMSELQELLACYESGTKVTMTVQSLVNGAYEEHIIDITLGSRPSDNMQS